MATQASIEIVQKMYIAYYGRPADVEGLNSWAEALDANGGDMVNIVNDFGTSAEATARFGGQSSAETITTLYQQMFGRDPESTDILNAWVDQLENNPAVTLQSIALEVMSGATGDDAAAINNKLAIANAFTTAMDTTEEQTAYAGDAAITAGTTLLDTVSATTDTATVDVDAALAALVVTNPNPNPSTGTTFTLTETTDRIDGTAENDTFDAYLAQNAFAGGVSNTLSSADKLNGMEGTDSLHAELVPEFFGTSGSYQVDIQARTESIENVTFEARDMSYGGGTVTVDAKNMTDIVEIGSKFSDGDLIIENLTTLTANGTARNTDVITVTMDHTDNFNSDGDASDLTVYFDEDYLKPTTTLGESSVVFKIMNQDSYDQNDGEMRLDGVYVARMEFSLNGTNYNLAPFIEENAQALGDEFKTEAELVAHLNAVALPALAAANPSVADALNSLEFSIGGKWNDNNQNRIGDEIVLTASNAHTLETRDAWLTIDQAELVDPGYASNRIERTGEVTGTDSETLSVNVELEKVGREGKGGDLTIGGKDQSEEGEGIDIFNISVKGDELKPNNLGSVSSTNNDLETVNIETHAAFAAGTTFASLTIRDGFGERNDNTDIVTAEALKAVNADSFKGDLTIGSDTDVLNLATLNASGGGDVKFYATVNAEDQSYDYNTGAGNDTIDLDISTDATDRVDTKLDVNTGSGNDTVNLNTAVEHASQQTMALFSNMSATTGAGNDKVTVTGDGRYNIDAGANDDFVVIDSSTAVAGAGTMGAWMFGRETAANAVDFADQVLYQATLIVTFAGLEQTVNVNTDADGNFVANQVIINAAIEEAIKQNPELVQLLKVTRGDGDQYMVVTSTVDGENDLEVSIAQPNVVAPNVTPAANEVEVGANDVLDLVEGLMQTNVANIDSNSDAAAIAGALNAATVVVEAANNGGSSNATGATNVNFSVIDMGSGNNDLVVLDSNDDSSNVLVVDQTFGKVTVVNFHDDAPQPAVATDSTVGQHAIDFTHYLSNQVDASNNTNNLSAAAVPVTLNNNANGANFVANSVNMIVNLQEVTANDETFDKLTADDLLKALNGDEAYANIGESNPTAMADLVGTTQNHVVMIENPNNDGEYKVFHLTSTLDANDSTTGANGDADNDDADFATAVQLGTMDFGDSINFNLVGSTDYTTEVANLISVADGGTVVVPTETYAVAASPATVNEGDSVTFTLNTTGVDAGTSVAYTIAETADFTAADLADGTQISGNFVVDADGSTDITVALATDSVAEAAETMTLTVAGETVNVTVNNVGADNSNTTTVAISAAGTVEADDATAETFQVTNGNYTTVINNFDLGTDFLDMDAPITGINLTNTADDGVAELSYSPDAGATVVTVQLTGLSSAEDLALTSVDGFNGTLI